MNRRSRESLILQIETYQNYQIESSTEKFSEIKEPITGEFTVDYYPSAENIYGLSFSLIPDFAKNMELKNDTSLKYGANSNSVYFSLNNYLKMFNMPLQLDYNYYQDDTNQNNYHRFQLINNSTIFLPYLGNSNLKTDVSLQASAFANKRNSRLRFDIIQDKNDDNYKLAYTVYTPDDKNSSYHNFSLGYNKKNIDNLFGYNRSLALNGNMYFYPYAMQNDKTYFSINNSLKKGNDNLTSRIILSPYYHNASASFYSFLNTYTQKDEQTNYYFDTNYYPEATSGYSRLGIKKGFSKGYSDPFNHYLETSYYSYAINSNSYLLLSYMLNFRNFDNKKILFKYLNGTVSRKFYNSNKSVSTIRLNSSGEITLINSWESTLYLMLEATKYDNPSTTLIDYQGFLIELRNNNQIINIDAKISLRSYPNDSSLNSFELSLVSYLKFIL